MTDAEQARAAHALAELNRAKTELAEHIAAGTIDDAGRALVESLIAEAELDYQYGLMRMLDKAMAELVRRDGR